MAGVGTVNNVPVVNGVAQIVFSIPVGTPSSAGGTVTATYTGTAGFAGTTSSGGGNGTLTFCVDNASTLLGVNLQPFAVLAGSAVTNVGPTVIIGDVGISPGLAVTGFPPGSVTAPSTIHVNDGPAGLAQTDLTTAYTTILNETVGFTNLTGLDLGGRTLTPGRYHFDTTAQLTGTLILDDQNNPSARFDFQIGSSLTTASGSSILFINGGADNVYWQVGSSATLGSSTVFAGNILANASISLDDTASIACGRALARSGAVTLIDNFIDPAPVDPTAIVTPSVAFAGFDMPTFSWTNVAGADHYYLWVNDRTTGQVALQVPNVIGNSYTPSALQALTPGHNFTWWVTAVGSTGAMDAWGIGSNLSLASLATPSVIGPNSASAAGAGLDTPTFSWTNSPGADHYYLWVTDRTTGQVAIRNQNVASTSWTPGGAQALTPGHSYSAWVAAVSTSGTVGSWSNAQAFSLAALTAPVLSAPSGTIAAGVGFDMPTFSWNNVAAANHYYVWVTDNTTGTAALKVDNIAGTTWTPLANQALTPGHRYTSWVAAVSTNGSITWSGGQNFALAALTAPIVNTLHGTPTGVLPTFAWTAVVGAASYVVWVNDQTTGQSQVLLTADLHGTGWTPTAPQALVAGHKYIWWVGAVCTNGSVTAWSRR